MASTSPDHNNEALLHESLLPTRRQLVPISSVSTDGRILSASANVLRQLPTGSVMAFYALSSFLTNRGECQPANWWLSLDLVILLTVSCSFFTFTDSFVLEGKLYYGVATPERLILLSKRRGETEHLSDLYSDELKKRRLGWDDCVRALFTALVFLAFALGDIGMQNCFFPQAGFDAKQLLKNMPLWWLLYRALYS